MEGRTIQEFVEEMAAEGKSLHQILTVALSCRWTNHKEEIEREFNGLKKRSVANIG